MVLHQILYIVNSYVHMENHSQLMYFGTVQLVCDV